MGLEKNSGPLEALDFTGYTDHSLFSDTLDSIKNRALLWLSFACSSNYGPLRANTFRQLNALKFLNLSFSKISSIELHAFDGLYNLTELHIEKIVEVKWSIPANMFPPSLLTLNLNNNNLGEINQDAFANLINLKSLSLSKCVINWISDAIFATENSLIYLDLSYNELNKQINFLSLFHDLKNLTILDMSYCIKFNLISNQDMFKSLVSLTNLSLAGNKIKTLPIDLFASVSDLQNLDLSDNNVEDWDDQTFMSVSHLKSISLASNKIQIIKPSFKTYWTGPIIIDLTDNPFNCWCEMIWFRGWMDDVTHSGNVTLIDSNKYTCSGPERYKNTFFGNLTAEEIDKDCYKPPVFIYIIVAASIAALVMLILSLVFYRYQWYIRWYLYLCFKKNPKHIYLSDNDENRPLLEKEYNIYLSYAEENYPWADHFVKKLKQESFVNCTAQRNPSSTNSETSSIHSQSQGGAEEPVGDLLAASSSTSLAPEISGKRQLIYFEADEMNATDRVIESLSMAIYASKNVIIGVSANYLNDRRRQFELSLIQTAMVERYGYGAKDHIILVALQESGQLVEQLPRYLRKHFSDSCLVWSELDNGQRVFWKKINKRLIKLSYI